MVNTATNSLDKHERIISRDMIKECAVQLFTEKGVENSSVNDIVKMAGIAKGTFYLYYQNKDDLINSVFDGYSDDFFKEVVKQGGDPPKIALLAKGMLEYFSKNPIFLKELKNNMNLHKNYPYVTKTMSTFSKFIINFINLDERYPMTQVEAYSEILIGTILDICYKLLIDKSIDEFSEGKIMLEDFMKRFFDCEEIFT
ncbi:MAG: TetR/AcrR family transcriptional regulator [bacterium]|nr:TetR/AcrR family transcriptional regulator [bacterium]